MMSATFDALVGVGRMLTGFEAAIQATAAKGASRRLVATWSNLGGQLMNKLTLTVLLALLVPAVSLAGIVKGTLWFRGRPMGKGVRIEIRHGSSVYQTVTDEHGRFRLIVGEVGSCRLIVKGKSQSPEMRILSMKSTVQYEVELYIEDSRYGLREKK